MNISNLLKKCLTPPHPTYQSRLSRQRANQFLQNEYARLPNGLRLNLGSGPRCFSTHILNLDLFAGERIDIQGDLLYLPIKDRSVDTIICTGVLEHISNPLQAIKEIYRVLKYEGKIFIEIPFMQTVHASPKDFYRWTADGIRELMHDFEIESFNIVAGPASSLAWLIQETMAMLFSFNNQTLYKIGLRIFGWIAIPFSCLDILLENNKMAWHAASGYAIVAQKCRHLKRDNE